MKMIRCFLKFHGCSNEMSCCASPRHIAFVQHCLLERHMNNVACVVFALEECFEKTTQNEQEQEQSMNLSNAYSSTVLKMIVLRELHVTYHETKSKFEDREIGTSGSVAEHLIGNQSSASRNDADTK